AFRTDRRRPGRNEPSAAAPERLLRNPARFARGVLPGRDSQRASSRRTPRRFVHHDGPVDVLDRAELLEVSGGPADHERIERGGVWEAGGGDGACRREVAAGVAGLEYDPPAAGEDRGQPAADSVAVVAAGRAAKPDAEEVLAVPAAAEEERLRRLDRSDVEVERSVAVGIESDHGTAVRFEIQALQEGAFLEHRRGGGAAGVPRAGAGETGALAAPAAGALAVEGPAAGDVIVPVGERLPPDLQLPVVVPAVAPHAVGRVDVRPGIVVEIRGDRAPVPSGPRGAGAAGRVGERVVGPLEEE